MNRSNAAKASGYVVAAGEGQCMRVRVPGRNGGYALTARAPLPRWNSHALLIGGQKKGSGSGVNGQRLPVQRRRRLEGRWKCHNHRCRRQVVVNGGRGEWRSAREGGGGVCGKPGADRGCVVWGVCVVWWGNRPKTILTWRYT